MRVRLFAALRELAGATEVEVDDRDAADVAGVIASLSARLGPRFDTIMAAGSVAVNGRTVDLGTRLQPTDEVALLPPVSGG